MSPETPHAVLVGATATGKSALALALARRDPSWELVSVDSMQVYRGMDIGTAKPTLAEQAEVPHHMIDRLDPWESSSVAWFQREVMAIIADIASRGRRALLVGGTGLYVQAIVDDLDIPGQFPAARATIEANPATAALFAQLQRQDPLGASRIDPGNRRRIVRALEVTVGSGRPFSSFGPGMEAHPPAPFTMVGIRRDPETLRVRIRERYDEQLAQGFLAEVAGLMAAPRPMSPTARQALGYLELAAFQAGEMSLSAAVDQAVARTARFARRQRAWFGRDPRISWLDATGEANLLVDDLAAHLGC